MVQTLTTVPHTIRQRSSIPNLLVLDSSTWSLFTMSMFLPSSVSISIYFDFGIDKGLCAYSSRWNSSSRDCRFVPLGTFVYRLHDRNPRNHHIYCRSSDCKMPFSMWRESVISFNHMILPFFMSKIEMMLDWFDSTMYLCILVYIIILYQKKRQCHVMPCLSYPSSVDW